MSVLVFDGYTLAADCASNDGQTLTPIVKLWKAEGMLIGGVGKLETVYIIRDWIAAGMKEWRDNSFANDPTTHVVMVTRDKGLLRYTNTMYPVEHGFKKVSLGTGRDFAYGALAMGATAIEAVEAANLYSTTCGLGVQSYNLKDLEE